MKQNASAYPLCRENAEVFLAMCNPAIALVLCMAGLVLLLFCFLPTWLLCALGVVLLAAGAALLAGAGLFCFLRQGIPSYLFLRTEFAFLDYEASAQDLQGVRLVIE